MPTFATLDEELAFLVTQIGKARAEKAGVSTGDSRPFALVESDAHDPTRKLFLRGTESVSEGYIHRLSFREPAPSNGDDPIGREYRRRNR